MDILTKLDIFDDFSQKELESFFKLSSYTIKKYSKNQIVHLENEICHSMDIVLEGRVSAQKIDEDGNILQVAQFLGGSLFGANLIFSTKNNYPMTLVAESDAVILSLSRELILSLGQANTQFLLGLLNAVSDKALILTDKIDSISLKTIREKIFDFLRYEYSLKKNLKINLDLTKKELAERLGIQRTSLSRELAKMRDDGIITFDHKSITIKKLDQIT